MLEIIQKILNIAVWAPSGDNSQPWRFVYDQSAATLEIYNIPGKDLPFYNFEQRGSLVAHGALIENICIASPSYGLHAECQTLPGGNDNLVARIHFIAAPASEDSLFSFIKLRMTNRKKYNMQPLSDEQKNRIRDSVAANSQITVVFAEEESARKKIGAALAENEKIVLATEHLHKPFFEHVVWTEEQEQRQKSGLYLKTLELLKPQQIIFKLASSWKKMQWLKKIGILNLIIKGNSEQNASAPALVALVSPGNTPADFLEIGKAMQRIWLTATALGLSAQPVTGILFLMQRVLVAQTEGLTESQVQLIKRAYIAIDQNFNIKEGTIKFIFRLGTADAPSSHCSRIDPKIEVVI